MSRRTLVLLCLVLGASPALAADDLSDFAFPEMNFDNVGSQDGRSVLERATATPPAGRATSHPAPPTRSPALTAVVGDGAAASDVSEASGVSAAGANSATTSLPPVVDSPNSYASPSDLPGIYDVSQPAMLSYGPSNVSPLLAYMQCDPYSCGDVWAGFAAQQAADRAAYCALPNCHCGGHHAALHAVPCTSGCDGSLSHGRHRHAKANRYTQRDSTPDMTSVGCDAGCVK